jgi:DNA-binding NarL/FixJ family response regulator
MLIIDPDAAARAQVTAAAAQFGCETLEASDGLSGLEFAVHAIARVRLAVVDIRLPDLDGYDVCIRLRDIGLQHNNLFPVLPFTGTGVMEMLLDEIGCERPCFKPATADRLDAALRRALDAPQRHLARTPLLTFARQRAERAEYEARQEQLGTVALLASSLPVRLGLRQLISGAERRIVAESAAAEPLVELLSVRRVNVFVADAADRIAATQLAAQHRLPLLLVATSAAEIAPLAREAPVLRQPYALIAATDERAPLLIATALAALSRGESFLHLPLEQLKAKREPPIPAVLAELLRSASLTRREREVLWLDAQGWNEDQIAERLRVATDSLGTYWKRAQRKLGLTKHETQEWLRKQIEQAGPSEPEVRERSVGGPQNS